MPQHVIVTEYSSKWEAGFEEEAEKIKRILKENCIAIYHIGSTAVKGLKAKPVIDIMPVVEDICRVDDQAAEFEKIGYEYLGEFGIAGRRLILRRIVTERKNLSRSWNKERFCGSDSRLRDERKGPRDGADQNPRPVFFTVPCRSAVLPVL